MTHTKDEALKLALEALESQHRDRLNYTLAKRSANATCAEFKVNTLSELIESGYMHGMGKQTESAITAIKQALAAPTVQKPVACVQDLDEVKRKHLVYEKGMDWKDPLYTTPPAAPVREPVAFQVIRGELCYKSQDDDQSYGMWCPVTPHTDLPFVDGTEFYTTPPAAQPAPVPLTDEQIETAVRDWCRTAFTEQEDEPSMIDIARAIEAAHGITKGQP